MMEVRCQMLMKSFASLALTAVLAAPAFSQPLDRETIAGDFADAMAFDIAPDGDVFITEREGRLLRVRPSTGGVFEVAKIPVEHLKKTDRDSPYAREDGLQGIALDPDFSKNHFIYLYYSHPEKIINRLARFTLKDGLLDLASEVVILDIPIERANKVCHHGGAIEFGPDGLLYLSTGDNTNPFETDGFNPTDEREGHEYANALRSAGNSNDLRGKILRIRVKPDGTYEIPEGNLFKPGTPKTRPEIYVMGLRNPFRFSVDQKKSTLYWGEVGPDSAKDSDRGPMGYDEVNQAKKAGFFGWPMVIADQKAYSKYDYATKTVTGKYDPAAPKNESRLNTGITDLPPANPAFIWYPYGESAEFPVMEKGGRNAMAGPVYYFDENRKFNILGKEGDATLLTYEWMRGKIYKAKLDKDEKLESLTVLADKFVHPMDLKMAADGSLWLLEYGSEWWFGTNGKLIHLTPQSTNKAPVLEVEKSGDKTFKVKTATDPENDRITITWYATTGATEVTLGTGTEATLNTDKATEVRAVATDGQGNTTVARIPLVEKPKQEHLALTIEGQPKSLGFDQELAIKIGNANIPNPNDVIIRARYIPATGHDSGGPSVSSEVEKLLTARLCFACHQVNVPSVGPNYVNVSLKYRDKADAVDYLKGKLKTGSAGVWGEVPMPPQIAVTDAEADTLVKAILGLSEGFSEAKGIDTKLKLSPAPANAAPGGAWEITAEAPGYLPFKQRISAK
jgi:cytochrome c